MNNTTRPYSRSRQCSIEGCERKHYGNGLCQMHNARLRRYGDPINGFARKPTVEERFWVKVSKDGPVPNCAPHLGPCWLWTGTLINASYGNFGVSAGRFSLAHRYSYESVVAPIPAGLTLDHLCRVPRCVNPDHLEPVTNAENIRRAAQANARPNCPRGHEYTPENTYIAPRGDRRCRECQRQTQRRQYRERRKQS